MTDPLPDPIPAATLILMRARASGPPELLMIERSPDMAFAAGALAFPGGRIDPEDHAAAASLPGADAAARIAALRETVEETGLGGDLSPEALTPFARWCPNFAETRRFDTLFFIAEARPDWPQPVAREAEAVRAFWASAADTLAENAAGRAHAIFPTRRNLERLARFASIEEARADAARHGVRKITPWVEERGGEKFLCIPEGAGYPVTAEPLATARRS
jgi:8-oxo-dGTP pyrophosphatase MutT (NUDIX family)